VWLEAKINAEPVNIFCSVFMGKIGDSNVYTSMVKLLAVKFGQVLDLYPHPSLPYSQSKFLVVLCGRNCNYNANMNGVEVSL